jgi:hypothetical protein
MNLNDWAKAIHDNAKAHGWHDKQRGFAEIIALCHSELSEALEEDRAGRPMIWAHDYEGERKIERPEDMPEGAKPEGIAVEMADCLIRILDWAGSKSLDIEGIVRMKHEYNKSRPYRHGKRY